uniref:SFRICE_032777 n=1 Tax=Spodoptera frugiperda TaxID=7108 RepID=A0A2H1X254_SPOFR
MAPVYMKLFILVVFLVGVGFCQNNTTTIAAVTPTAATTATTATGTSVSSSSSSATVATSSPTTATQSMAQNFGAFVTAVPWGIVQACKYGAKTFESFLRAIIAHKQF